MSHFNMNYLLTGSTPKRMETAHSKIVPYQAFACSDDMLVVTVGNNSQFQQFCEALQLPALAESDQFITGAARAQHRSVLVETLAAEFLKDRGRRRTKKLTAAGITYGLINDLGKVFDEAARVCHQ